MEKVEGQGSVWNTGSYFWEEKSVGKWADERLKEILGSYRYTFGGGELAITSISGFKGESSISIRKGKKIISYDYNINMKFDCVMKDGDGNTLGTIQGEYEMPEMSNDVADDGDDWEFRVNVTKDESNLKSRMDNVIRKECPKDLRKVIKEKFVDELK